MKRRASIISLLLCMSLLFTGSPGILAFADNGELPVAWLDGTPETISPEDLDAIPVATPDMTKDELRQICVDFMRLQQGFIWTPAGDLDYLCASASTADENGLLHYKAGQYYAGLPYGGGSATLYSALDYYDPDTGVWDVSALVSGTAFPLTNDCGTSVVWSLSRVCNSLSKFGGTVTMTKKNGFLPVGPYQYDFEIEKYTASEKTLSKAICQTNGEQVMFESYAQVRKADGIVRRYQENGHARMVVEDAFVVRKGDGTIDGAKSYLKTCEQSSGKSTRESYGHTVIQNGWIDKQYTFSKLFKDGYLPFTVAELIGSEPVERAQVSLSNTGSDLSFDALRKEVVHTNYPIAKVALTLTGADGHLVYKETKNVKLSKLYADYTLSDLIPASLSASGHVLIEATVGTGETLPVYEGEACYDASGLFHGSHDYIAVVTDPTLTTGGYTTYTCSRCGNTYVADETEALGPLWGDANGDGSVNNKDIVCLKNYLAYYDAEGQTSVHEGVTYSLKSGADANGDGKENNADIVRLKKYLMFFDELTGKSMDGENEIVLGPAS